MYYIRNVTCIYNGDDIKDICSNGLPLLKQKILIYVPNYHIMQILKRENIHESALRKICQIKY